MKNKKLQRAKVWGRRSTPAARSSMREKHLKHIIQWCEKFLGVPARVTPGKFNQAGKFIKKPDWSSGFLEFEPNPDAAVHELAHLILATPGEGLAEIQRSMDKQFGFVIKHYGYMKQKRSAFEVLPMGLEQKLRRVLGLPPSMHGVKVEAGAPIRTAVEDNKTPIAKRVKTRGGYKDLIRLSSNLDAGCLRRLDAVLNGELTFDVNRGWIPKRGVNARINRRAKLKGGLL